MHPSSYSGSRIRPELPVHHAVALSVRGLMLTSDRGDGADPVGGATFEVQTGSLVVLSPASQGRTVLLYLAGRYGRVGRDDPPHGPPAGSGNGGPHLIIAKPPAPTSAQVRTVLGHAGTAARSSALRLGLADVLDGHIGDLTPAQQTLLGVAMAVGVSPDVIALDDPGEGLDVTSLVAVVDALRDLVDIEGRTAILSSDRGAIPDNVGDLIDQFIDLEAPH